MLEDFLREHRVASVLDVGCGDWQFSQLVNWGTTFYIGIDICHSVICRVRRKHDSPRRLFLHGNFLDPAWHWPAEQLLIVKDVLHHIPSESVPYIVEKSKSYPWVLWTADFHPDGRVANVPQDLQPHFAGLQEVFRFDTSPPYRYGTKMTLLQTGT